MPAKRKPSRIQRIINRKKEVRQYQKFTPFPAQMEILKDNTRFKCLNCGRRFGKTVVGSVAGGNIAVTSPNKKVWIIAPVYYQAQLVMAELNRFLPPSYIEKSHGYYGDKYLKNGSIISVKTALHPDRLRGDEPDYVIFDEFAYMDGHTIWNEIIRAALATKRGGAMFISSPRGKNNEFYRIFQMGMSDEHPEYKSWHFSSKDSPYFPPDEYEALKKVTPHNIFMQEYEALFVDSISSVFHEIEENCTFDLSGRYSGEGEIIIQKCDRDHWYTAGVDVGNLSSYTVICVIDNNTGSLVYFNRFRRTGYKDIVAKIKKAHKLYNCKARIDSTGIGVPTIEAAKAENVWVEPFLFTNSSKQRLVSHLQVLIENHHINYPYIKPLIEELRELQFEYTKQMNIVYTSSIHTDCIYGLALAALDFHPGLDESVIVLPVSV